MDAEANQPKTLPDWDRIELDYRAGIKPLRQIASENGISEGAIRKRAKRDEWTRDLSGRIQDKAEQLVRKDVVRNAVRTETAVTERVLVEVNAQAVADVRLSHRRDIGRGRGRALVMSLLSELEAVCGVENAALLTELGDMMRRPDQHGQDKFNDLYQKLVSLPGRAKTTGEYLRILARLHISVKRRVEIRGNPTGGAMTP